MDNYDNWKTACCGKYPYCSDCDKEESEPVYTCYWCESPIHEGEEYIEIEKQKICRHCLEEKMQKARR